MSNTPHIPFEQLVDFAEGRLPAAARAALLAQVATDPQATAELAELERLFGLMRDDSSEDAPDYVINRALRLVRTPAPVAGLRRRLVAALSFDSRSAGPAFGVRSGTPAARQLLFQSDDCDIDLRLAESATGWAVAGQVLGPEAGGTITLTGAAQQQTAALNQLSEFSLPPVPAGIYTLTLQQGEVEVVIEGLELG